MKKTFSRRTEDSLRITRLLNEVLHHNLEGERKNVKILIGMQDVILDSYIRLYHHIMEVETMDALRTAAEKELRTLKETIGVDDYPADTNGVCDTEPSPDQEI